jgi:LPXTG-motif cell wall-anchored protein
MDEGSNELSASDYALITTGLTDGCTFHIVFQKSYLDTIKAATTIRVHYAAVLNENAKVVNTGTEVNQNATYLSYGNAPSVTTTSTVTVKTFQFQLVKTDSNYNVLQGATFRLYTSETGEDSRIYVSKKEDGVYLVDTSAEAAENDVLISAGTPTIQGVGNGVYYLEEVAAPAGYNKLDGRIEITINGSGSMASFNEDGTYIPNGGGFQVENKKGDLLPSTGGTGVILLYIGGILLLAGGCLLLIRCRKKKTD